MFHYLIFIQLGGAVLGQGRLDCRTETLNTCIKLADPLLEDPKYVFPSNNQDVDHVCNVLFPKTWSEFVTCIKRYTSDCLTPDQRSDFNRAVGDSINSVHKMCTNEAYKRDYMEHAECIKEMSTSSAYCGAHYSRLVEMVKGVTPSSQQELCCSHTAFKTCVIHETRRCAGPAGAQMTAQDFARAMLDKSLGFLLKQCQDYVPRSSDCPGYDLPVEKKPRRIEQVGEDNYYPSGDRERRPLQEGTLDSGDSRDPDWTDLNPQQREQIEPLDDPFELEPLQPLQPLDPITEQNVLEPVRTDRPRPRLEDEEGWKSQRKPWLPDINTDIKSFEDIFGNVVDSFAEPRTSGASSNLLLNVNILILCSLVSLLSLATRQ